MKRKIYYCYDAMCDVTFIAEVIDGDMYVMDAHNSIMDNIGDEGKAGYLTSLDVFNHVNDIKPILIG